MILPFALHTSLKRLSGSTFLSFIIGRYIHGKEKVKTVRLSPQCNEYIWVSCF